jgi:penicillin amidase
MRRANLLFVLVLSISVALCATGQNAGAPSQLPGLIAAAEVVRDTNGIAHIRASNDHDMAFLQGYTHAEDRLFQMDFYRHLGSGTLAELVGTAALPQDVQLRTLGLRRAATRSYEISSPRVKAILHAYADGVNAYVATHPLPPEYGALGITQLDPWVPVDSLTIAKVIIFNLAFDTFDVDYTVALMSYMQAGVALGFDGAKLFSDDLFRSAPFDPAATIPDATSTTLMAAPKGSHPDVPRVSEKALDLTKKYLNSIKRLEFFQQLRSGQRGGASNEWVVSGKLTTTGAPLMANDPHLTLAYPAIWYPMELSAGDLDVIGNSFAGTPLITLGHNRWISWGATTTYADITDWYQEQLVPDGSSPSGFSTLYKGNLEHVIPIPETFRVRMGGQLVTIPPGNGIPAATLIVPRRNNGPIVNFDPATGVAISVQWAAFSGSRELDATLTWAEAKTPDDFARGVRYFNGPQNFAYIDRKGNFGYFMSGELPIREDLQAGFVAGMPPYLLRNGQGGNEWLPVQHPQPQQALPYEILPFEELPHVLNPSAGWAVNANNDPLGLTLDNNPLNTPRKGGGIYYLAYEFNPGMRAGRITELLKSKISNGKVSFKDMQKIQADTALRDAAFFVPYITAAFDDAKLPGAAPQLLAIANDPQVAEAIGRLRSWNFTTPTGIPEGYDAFDVAGQLNPRSAAEIANSVSATIYSTWRSEFIKSVIDSKLIPYGLPTPDDSRSLTALRHLLENFGTNQGFGASALNFFPAPGVTSANDRRDIYILQAVKSALNLLASNSFKNAFANSTNQNDYRWGKLHRIVFAHPLDSLFSVPPAGGMFPAPLPNLAGVPVDGAFQTVDVGNHNLRVSDENGFMWTLGPSERSVAEGGHNGVIGVSSLPGGISGVLGSPLYVNLLQQYLVNDTYPQLFRTNELEGSVHSVAKYVP